MAKSKQQVLIDTEITELHSLAEDYAEIRDRRMELNKQESELKTKLLTTMKKHNKKDYVNDGIEVHVVAEEETVKVKIQHKKDDEE